MSKIAAISEDEECNLLRTALLRNHLQEQMDNAAAETLAKDSLHDRHRRELAQISLLVRPPGWTMAIDRYTKQFAELHLVNRFRRELIKTRQAQERAELERWIQHQQAQRDETAVFDQYGTLFDWALTHRQRNQYHEALTNGFTLILTDLTKSILWTSRNFLSMTGYQPIDVLGKTPHFLQGPDTDQTTVKLIRDRLSKAESVKTDLINYRRNGQPYVCQLQITPLRNRHGELTHFLAVEWEAESRNG